MRILHYCQHVLGLGHICRSLEIDRALTGHDIVFVSGGAATGAVFPDHVRLVSLPALMMDEDFTVLLSQDGDPEEIMAERARILYSLVDEFRPEAFIIELYPFGRRRFDPELLPVLKDIRAGRFGRVLTACSLRDILVEKRDPAGFEKKVLKRLNLYFDALLVHSDPTFQALDETFTRMTDIAVPVVYTGFVAQRPAPGARERVRRSMGLAAGEVLVTVSAGGGRVGGPLLRAALRACAEVARERPLRFLAFSGPYLDEVEYAALREAAAPLPGFAVERFSAEFPDLLAASDLSVSMGGYNTSLNLVAAGTFGLMKTYDQNREQRLRAEKLQAMGLVRILEDEDLGPARLADIIRAGLERPRPSQPLLDLNGAANTARWLEGKLQADGAEEVAV